LTGREWFLCSLQQVVPQNFVERSKAVPRKQKSGKLKLKTHKATSKRFRLTGSGVLVRTKGGKSHLRRRTSKRTKALLDEMIVVKGEKIITTVKRLAPTLSK
jgi:large subunit ribosomal protein L35